MTTAEQITKQKPPSLIKFVGKVLRMPGLETPKIKGIITNPFSTGSISEISPLKVEAELSKKIAQIEENIAEVANTLIEIGKTNFDLILRAAVEQQTLKKALTMFPNRLSKDRIKILFEPIWGFKQQIKTIPEEKLNSCSDLLKTIFKITHSSLDTTQPRRT